MDQVAQDTTADATAATAAASPAGQSSADSSAYLDPSSAGSDAVLGKRRKDEDDVAAARARYLERKAAGLLAKK